MKRRKWGSKEHENRLQGTHTTLSPYVRSLISAPLFPLLRPRHHLSHTSGQDDEAGKSAAPFPLPAAGGPSDGTKLILMFPLFLSSCFWDNGFFRSEEKREYSCTVCRLVSSGSKSDPRSYVRPLSRGTKLSDRRNLIMRRERERDLLISHSLVL